MKPLLFAILLFASAHTLHAQSPVMDGKLSDWMDQTFTLDPATNLNYSVRNDGEALYLAVQALEERTQRRVMRLGFKIALDPGGKKKERTAIVYKPEMPVPGQQRAERPSREQIFKTFLESPLQLQLSGFSGIKDGNYYTIELPDIVMAADVDSTLALNMEVKIPFSTLPKYKSGKPIGIGLMLLAFERPEGMPPGGMGGPGMGGGRGGRGGGMGQGGPPGGGRGGIGGRPGGFAEMAEQKTVWITYEVRQ
jgi:hypothetical protein